MSYLVLALGVFLSLSGAFAITEGYAIIQVERGWATFIAGAMAFSCGIVTLALGLILHRLTSVHALLKSGNRLTPPLHEPARQTPSELSPISTPESSIAPETIPAIAPAPPPASSARSWPQRPMRSNLTAARNFLKSRGTVWPSARGTSESEYSPQKVSPLSRDGLRAAQTSAEPPSEPVFDRPDEAAIARAEEKAETPSAFSPAGEASAERAWHADSGPGLFDEAPHKTEAPPIGQPHPEIQNSPRETEAQSVRGENWPVERASIDTIIEEELIIALDPALHSQNEDSGLSPGADGPAFGSGAAPAVPEHTPEPPPAVSSAGQEEVAIVGQYESAGTSYVMYSDGSIEARTEHAVFHFKSMAELKAFMDSEAQNSRD